MAESITDEKIIEESVKESHDAEEIAYDAKAEVSALRGEVNELKEALTRFLEVEKKEHEEKPEEEEVVEEVIEETAPAPEPKTKKERREEKKEETQEKKYGSRRWFGDR